ncbi:MAG: glycerophosphodiester phosphodiesterase [Opitutus sp.]|nr:glycerophosphodiester phosphodiesterase [Opitutus sp.]MCS6245971.1 glycerophosphodiester phosphodiesterase [Opitutus sp.]MCS6275340.1 glycerophosphodiester phosphodiesterase [Opitutus sp.]MCS6301043.1 glycerophosphodiester phosphodiesterase [Opitutus sp.]
MIPPVILVAHRGASQEAPETTVASVSLGWAQQADAVEIDVHLTRDGQVVAIHDPTLLRTTGRDARVDELTLAEIQKLDAGVWKSAAYRHERVPTLAEVLATVPSGRRLYVELKAAEGLVPALRRAIEAGPVPLEQIVLISFEAATLSEAKRALPLCPAFFLADTPDSAPDKLAEMIRFCQAEGFAGLDVSAGWPINKALVQRLREAKLELHVWTVNDPRRARELVDAGVASITTDRPGWLRAKLAGL